MGEGICRLEGMESSVGRMGNTFGFQSVFGFGIQYGLQIYLGFAYKIRQQGLGDVNGSGAMPQFVCGIRLTNLILISTNLCLFVCSIPFAADLDTMRNFK